jgi:hypothetical protein
VHSSGNVAAVDCPSDSLFFSPLPNLWSFLQSNFYHSSYHAYFLSLLSLNTLFPKKFAMPLAWEPSSTPVQHTQLYNAALQYANKRSPYNLPWKPSGGVDVQLCSSFNLGAGIGWVVHAMPRALYPRDEDPVHLYRRLCGPQGRSGRVRKICPHPDRIRFPDRPVRSESWQANGEL